MEVEHIPISDFAERVGVTKQAIYKRLKKDLKPYCKTINGVKYISLTALELFAVQEVDQPAAAGREQRQEDESLMIPYLMKQLEEKDRLIESLTSEVGELRRHVITQSESITEILKKQSQLQENLQFLLSQQQHMIAIEQHSTVEQDNVVIHMDEKKAVESVESSANQDSKCKGGLLYWLLRK